MKINLSRLKTLVLSAWLLVALVGLSLPQILAQDATQNNLNQQLQNINARISETNLQLDGVAEKRKTLEETIADLQSQVAYLRGQIGDTQAELDRLEAEITLKQQELDEQKIILTRILRVLYQNSDASAFELLITSDTFGEYVDRQEYLERLKAGVSDSVERIQELKQSLEAEEAQQAQLLSELEAQEISLLAVQYEQQHLLEETQGEEATFQAHLEELEAEYRRIQEQLRVYLSSLVQQQVSLGPVAAGTAIGKLGNTGWSTGPHLHLEIYDANFNRISPLPFLNNNNLVWPVGGGGGWISQSFHPGHRALDVAGPEGTAIKAIAGGTMIHRGCLNVGTDYANFAVIINHGSYYSLYVHLQAPNNPIYAECSINRRNSYGTPSIDYSITH